MHLGRLWGTCRYIFQHHGEAGYQGAMENMIPCLVHMDGRIMMIMEIVLGYSTFPGEVGQYCGRIVGLFNKMRI